MKVIKSIDDAQALAGQELGVSQWLEIDQKRINDFADVTGDHQWIHVDVERAKAESPYRTPIAHGFLTLSLVPALSKDNHRVENAKLAINYGPNKVRFLVGGSGGQPGPDALGTRRRRQGRRQHGQPHGEADASRSTGWTTRRRWPR